VLLALSSISIIPEADKVLGRDPMYQLSQLVPIARFTADPTVLAVKADAPWKSAAEFVEAARKAPGSIPYGSSGNYGTMHVPMEMLNASAGTKMLHIPYKGGGPAMVTLVSGEGAVGFATAPSVIGHIKSGRMKALAVTSAVRAPLLPDVPTVSEAGVPGYEAGAWYGFLVPTGTPKDALSRLESETIKVLKLMDVKEKLAVTEGLLYRRGNFNGTFDQLVLDALMEVKGAEIGFSPGFRWGTTLLPGQPILREHVMDQTAITYPYATLNDLTGAQIKTILEDVADNLFNPDPYYQQGGDMVRVGGLQYTCNPVADMGRRITDMRLGGKPIQASRQYKVAGWAPVAEQARTAPGARPVWEVVEEWLRARKGVVSARQPNLPKLSGVLPNPGVAPGAA
jgi:hypothetical protein